MGRRDNGTFDLEVPKDTVVSKLDLKVNQGDKSTMSNLNNYRGN